MTSDDSSTEREFLVDLAVHRLVVVKKAAYRFAGDYEVTIESAGVDHVRVRMSPKPRRTGRWHASMFLQELIDQELREVVADETRAIRDLLLAHTFSGLPITDPVGEVADAESDPLGARRADKPARVEPEAS